MFSKNVHLKKPLKLSAWRKIAIGSWPKIGDPSVYGMIEFDVEPALAYIEKLKSENQVRITLTHFIAAAVGKTIGKNPQINCILRWGRLYPRETVDLFFQVASDTKGEDLSGTLIRNADQKSVVEIAREMEAKVTEIRVKKDPGYRKMKNLFSIVPGILAGPILGFSRFLMYGLNLWSPLLGAPRDSFGSCMITNIGSLGLDIAWAPLVPYSHVPFLIAVSAVREEPVVKDGKVTVGKRLTFGVTVDHRVIDGVHASYMARTVREIFENPSILGR